MRTYVFGDLHGCLRQLERLFALCETDGGSCQKLFVFLGDYIDRGPSSRGVIEFLINLQTERPTEIICLAGNHEELALAALEGEPHETRWHRNGGLATLHSYGIATAAELPGEHLRWLDKLPTHHDDGQRFFVHAGIHPGRPLDQQDAHDLVWIREPFLSHQGHYNRLIVHGHSPIRDGKPDQRPNRLNIDTGAVYGGPLTAAIFDDHSREPVGFLQVS